MRPRHPRRHRLPALAVLAAAACAGDGTTVPAPEATTRIGDFAPTWSYVDDEGAVIARRYEHVGNGMPVTLLRLQSVPQVFLYVNTPPVSDQGEPHTGEHLLLGKGRKGRQLALEQEMSLVGSTAYTSQTDVVYSWNCAAGRETFYRTVEQVLEALLLPDYTDEEIRREVCNLGVKRDPETGALSLEEKGTIYNEMVSSFEKRWLLWNDVQRRVWGPDHPLSYSSGGRPAAVRTLQPEDIHDFHQQHYHLSANMGMLVALPESVPQDEFLRRLGDDVAALDATPELSTRPKLQHAIPPARPSADRSFQRFEYPNENESDIAVALLAWPPVVPASQRERVLSELFLAALGEGQTATLYKRLMDGATREVELDASQLSAWLHVTKVDAAPYLALDGLPPRNATAERMDEVVAVLHDEVARVAALEEGSDELGVFNDKVLAKLTERERNLRKQLNSPPLFGHRGSGGFWLDHLRLVDLEGGDARSLTLRPLFTALREELGAGANPWRGVVETLGLRERPYVSCCVPSSAELARRRAAKAARLQRDVEELEVRYGVDDGQEAIRRYLADYDAASAELAALDQDLPKPHLVPDVPLTLDPSLVLEETDVVGVPAHRGVFDNMTFVEVVLALRLEGVAPSRYHWLPILPAFLTRAGVVEDGAAIPYDTVQEQRAQEIYALSAAFASRPDRGRHELTLTAAGADLGETRRAVEWLELSLFSPWVDVANISRLRDLVSQAISDTRTELGGREERWVQNPAAALRHQRDPLYVSMSSHHARLFHLARLEWLLMDAPAGGDAETVELGLAAIAGLAVRTPEDAPETLRLLESFVEQAKVGDEAMRKWLVPVAERIREMVGDMGVGTVARDLQLLTETAAIDLSVPPADALREFDALRRELVRRGNARFVLTGSRAGLDAIAPRLSGTVAHMGDGVSPRRASASPGIVLGRLRDHDRDPVDPVHYALVHKAGTSGVFVFSTGTAGYDDLDEETLVRELAGRVFGGQGPHGFFMQTWGAGLAYSNGIGANPAARRMFYYAERCPDLVETMKFVVGLVRHAGDLDDPHLAEYAVAGAVSSTRESSRYEARTRAAAADLVDGDTPERVSAWRKAVLALRADPNLWRCMRPHIEEMTGRVLPGIGPRARDGRDPRFLVIAPERLIAGWERYVRAQESEDERVARITGRDFWVLPVRE